MSGVDDPGGHLVIGRQYAVPLPHPFPDVFPGEFIGRFLLIVEMDDIGRAHRQAGHAHRLLVGLQSGDAVDVGLQAADENDPLATTVVDEVLHHGQGAGTARSRYVYLMTRNRLAVLTKNIPLELFFKHIYTLLFGQFYFFLVYKRPFHSLAGTVSFLIALPRLLRQRQVIQKRKRSSNEALEPMLSYDLGEPSLREIIKTNLGWN